jgi:hypothetical protein
MHLPLLGNLPRKGDFPCAGRSHNIKTGNKSSERVEELKYLGTPLTNTNSIHDEIKGRSKTGNACYYSVLNLPGFQFTFQIYTKL